MWKTVQSSSSTTAQDFRRLCINHDVTSVVVMDGTITMVEQVLSQKSRKKKDKEKRDNGSRLKQFLDDTGSWITNESPKPLKRTDWQIAPCGIGVINKNFNRHVGRCLTCIEIRENTPVNRSASVAVGGEPRTPAQQSLDKQRDKADDINKFAEVTTVQVGKQNGKPLLVNLQGEVTTEPVVEPVVEAPKELEAEIYKDRGEDFIRYKEKEPEKLSEMIARLESELSEVHNVLADRETQLLKIFEDMKQWIEGQDKVQKELREIDIQLQQLNARKAKLQQSA